MKKTNTISEVPTYKVLSHVDRLKNPIHKPTNYPQLQEHYSFAIEQVLDKNTNRVSKRMVRKKDNPAPYEHLKVSDFCLENLQASGAINQCHPCSLSHDSHTILTTLENSAVNIVNSSKS